MGPIEIKTRINKGYTRISELKSRNEDVPQEWITHLSSLAEEYKTNAINTLLDNVNAHYPYGLMAWLLNYNKPFYDKNNLIEDNINKSYECNTNDLDKFDELVIELSEWYKQAITLYKNKKEDNQSFNTAPVIGANFIKGGKNDMVLLAKAPKRQLCPEGVHDAQLANAEHRHHEEWGERVLLTFDVDGFSNDDGSDMKVFEECSFMLTPKSKLRKIVEAIMNQKLSKDQAEEGVDLEAMLGHKCQLVITHKEGKDGNVYARVESVIAAK